MKIILFGAGTIGAAVEKKLAEHGHEVLVVRRGEGGLRADLTNAHSLRALFEQIGRFDAVASAAGEAVSAPLLGSTDRQWASSFASKAIGQIDLVRAALPYIADGGSFTLVTGILADEPIANSVISATVNAAVEGFVRAAAHELPRGIRINAVSPTVLAESKAYHPYFPGFVPVPAEEVAMAYLRAIATPMNGRVLKVHKTG